MNVETHKKSNFNPFSSLRPIKFHEEWVTSEINLKKTTSTWSNPLTKIQFLDAVKQYNGVEISPARPPASPSCYRI